MTTAANWGCPPGTPSHPTARSPLAELWFQPAGPLTADLVRRPGGFGLGQVPATKVPDATTPMVCGFCSTGCSLNIHLKNGEAIGLTPTTGYSVNLGMACPKGWEALSALQAADRATVPLLKDERGRQRAVTWDQALATFCRRMKAIQQRHGPHAVAFLSTGQIATEEMALLGAVAKFGMGMLHGDGNTRQCMATSVVAYKQAFGFDAPPYTYADLEASDVIVLIGSNLCIAHPILWQRICRNRHEPKIIVIDPRKTETAMAATLHVPLRPKSDLVLLYAIAHVLLREGWIDADFIAAHTSGFEGFREHVAGFTPERAAAECGIDEALIQKLARTIHEGRRVSLWWTMGVNQSYEGVRTAQAIINLALLTGNLGRPGTGANSITGQCNAMGSRLFSNTTNLLGGHDFANPDHRRKVAGILNIDEGIIPDRPSWAYDQIIEGILQEKIKGLWVIATNPAHSWINQHMLRDVLSRLEFLVVQDMYHTTETAQLADLVLPAAAWGEKEGTFINSERRVGVIKRVAKAPGQALADFSIFRLVAEYWGCGRMFDRWTSPAAVFELLKELSRGQPCDITGIRDYEMLDAAGGIQWPWPECGMRNAECGVEETLSDYSAIRNPQSAFETERRLFADGQFYHPDGRARFLFDKPASMPEPPNERFPLLLITGRGTASQWHTQTRTGKSPVLRKLYPPGVYVEINPADARAANVKPNQRVIVQSQRGSMVAKAFVTHTVQPGQVFIPMHYETVNQLTLAHFDPHSRQPSYKDCAVRVYPAHLPEQSAAH
jgi:assimilatory nitrate reductase catalytic subunit